MLPLISSFLKLFGSAVYLVQAYVVNLKNHRITTSMWCGWHEETLLISSYFQGLDLEFWNLEVKPQSFQVRFNRGSATKKRYVGNFLVLWSRHITKQYSYIFFVEYKRRLPYCVILIIYNNYSAFTAKKRRVTWVEFSSSQRHEKKNGHKEEWEHVFVFNKSDMLLLICVALKSLLPLMDYTYLNLLLYK